MSSVWSRVAQHDLRFFDPKGIGYQRLIRLVPLVLGALFSAPLSAKVLDIPPAQLAGFLSANNDVVVQFTSPDSRCIYCTNAAKKTFNEISDRVGMGVQFIRVQWSPWSDFPKVVTQFGVYGIPSVEAFKGGKPEGSLEGTLKNPKSFIVALKKFYFHPTHVQKSGGVASIPEGDTEERPVTIIHPGSTQSGNVIAVPAGSTQSRTISVPWSGKQTGVPTLSVREGPATVTASAEALQRGALLIRITCPSTIAPGLYPLALVVGSGAHATTVTLRLTVEALYLSTHARGGGTAGVLVESPTGQVLPQATAALSQQFTTTHSPWGITYDPQNQALYTASEGHVPVAVTTTLGRPLPIIYPPHTAGGSLSFADWLGGHRIAFSSIDGDPAIYTDNGVEIAANDSPGRFDFHWGGEQAQTANPDTGTLFLSNNAVSTGLPMDEIQSYSNQGVPEQTWPVARAVVAMVFNPWNNLLYVLTSHLTQTDQHFRVFHPDGTPAFAFPRIAGITTAQCPLGQKLAANPMNGHLYLLTKQRIWVLSPQGRVIRTLKSPPGANSIAFIPQTLLLPSRGSYTAQPVPTTSNQIPPSTTRTAPAFTTPSSCPPGYRCVPKAPQPSSTSPQPPSLNHALNQATNTASNLNNLTSAVSGVLNALH